MYVVDTSIISALHRNYYRTRFVTLWERFDAMVADGKFTSTREAFRELEDLGGDGLDWAQKNVGLFTTPNANMPLNYFQFDLSVRQAGVEQA
jgi:hypothetical protein